MASRLPSLDGDLVALCTVLPIADAVQDHLLYGQYPLVHDEDGMPSDGCALYCNIIQVPHNTRSNPLFELYETYIPVSCTHVSCVYREVAKNG